MKYVKEIMWIIAFTFLGELLNTLLPLPVPAGVYGMILLLIALVTGIVKLPEVEGAGNFLLDTMTMMFIPAAVGIMSAIDILLPVLLPYLVIIVVSTVLVMIVTGLTATAILRRSESNMVIAVLVIFQIPYEDYKASANLLSYLLTPATVCLAIPMYKQLRLLKDNLVAVLAAITAGTLCSILSILIMGKLFGLSVEHIATLLPKSITTAIGMGVSEEAGGIVTLTVAAIIITGILGNMIAELVFQLFHIDHPIARGLALGTSAHAVGTAKALELGEIEGAMGSISICVAGILTVVLVPLVMNVA